MRTLGLDRRRFLVGAVAAVVVGACGRTEERPPTSAEIARTPPPSAPPELDTNAPVHDEDARVFFVVVPVSIRTRAGALLPPETVAGLSHGGLLALSDVCPADRLQLRFCQTSAWFECPGCGSQFDALGDKKGGPAPFGMSLHAVDVDDRGHVSVRAHPRYDGLPSGTILVRHEPAGPHCS